MAVDPKIAGKIGTPPPPGAPVEKTQPLTAEALQAQLAAASRNEKTLAPLNFAKTAQIPPVSAMKKDDLPVAAPARPDPSATAAFHVEQGADGLVSAPETGVAASTAPSVAEAEGIGATTAPSAPVELVGDAANSALSEAFQRLQAARKAETATAAPDEPYRPAASDTDSPSRGVPRPVLDPGKQPTGGFGAVGEAQYFPMDGSELKLVVEGLLGTIAHRIQNDLRFSPAICYPRVRVRAEVIVESYAVDPWIVPVVAKEHDRTPVDVAREYGHEVVFVLVEQRQEFTKDGEIESPANAIRMEIGVTPPRKQMVEVPGGRMMVDVVPSAAPGGGR